MKLEKLSQIEKEIKKFDNIKDVEVINIGDLFDGTIKIKKDIKNKGKYLLNIPISLPTEGLIVDEKSIPLNGVDWKKLPFLILIKNK